MKQIKKTAASIPMALLLGVVSALTITAAVSVLVTFLIYGETIEPQMLGYGSVGILIAGSATGAFVSGRRAAEYRILVTLLSGVIYLLIHLAVTALFLGGQYSGIGPTVITVMGTCGAVSLLHLSGKTVGRKRRIRYKTH